MAHLAGMQTRLPTAITDGKLGLSFTKISTLGEEVAASATSWSCVKDNITGLIWEVKTTGGLQDFMAQYTNLDSTTPNQLGPPVPPATTDDPTTMQI